MNKMNKSDLLGYGAASFADSGPYNFVTVFFILYLTTVAGISPERAGTISSVTILLDGLAGALLGYLSDSIRSKSGRRRPFLLASALPLLVGIIFMFTDIHASGTSRSLFYLAAGLLFWTGFGMYYTPYTALGAEMTRDYDERSVLRTYCRYFALAGNFLGVVFPLMIVRGFQHLGLSESGGWTSMAALMGVLSALCILITWHTSRGRDIPPSEPAPKVSLSGLLRDYLRIVRLKPFRYICAIMALFMMANTFYNSSMVFYARYSLGVDDSITSVIFLITMLANLAYTPVAGALAVRYDKKYVLACSMIVSGIAGLVFFIIEIHSFLGLAVYACLFSIAYSCFWQLMNALIYDLSEVGEFKTGRRIEGSISSVTSLVFTLSTSLATQILGWILRFRLYRPAFLLLPALFLIAAGLIQTIYPMNKERFDLLKAAIADRNAGREPDLRDLGKIL